MCNEAFPAEEGGLVQWLGLLCLPRGLPPFGLGSVTIFTLALSRAWSTDRVLMRSSGKKVYLSTGIGRFMDLQD